MYRFTKEDTKLLKGVAIVLMLAHHLFTYTSRIGTDMYPVSFTKIGEYDTAKYIGDFGQICVAMFLFLAGYGIFKSYKENEFYVVKKIYGMYRSMWKVMLIFVPIGFIWCSNQFAYCAEPNIYSVFSRKFTIPNLVSNMLAFSCEYNQEWWFIRVYIVALISFPLVVKLIKRNNIWTNIWLLFSYVVVLDYVVPQIYDTHLFENICGSFIYRNFFAQNCNMASFWMGCILAKDDVFEKGIQKFEELGFSSFLKDCIGIVMIMVCRNNLLGDELDFVYIPILFIICRDLLLRTRFLKSCFYVIGEESMNIWLVHSFFCYYFYPMVVIVYLPKYAFLVLPWLIIISLIASRAMEFVYGMFAQIKERIETVTPRLRSQE